ncbi:unnamed protein product, partial [Pocillopora meandrina]
NYTYRRTKNPISNNDIDIISINETKLNESIQDHEVHIPGYEIIRRDRLTKGGGGVCFYVKNSINFTVRSDLHMDALENLCLEIHKPKTRPFVIQLIAEPTRITPTSSTLIDLIYTNCSDKIACSGVCHVGISDHSMVYVYRKLALNGMSNGHNSITYRNFRKFDCQNFRDDIQ